MTCAGAPPYSLAARPSGTAPHSTPPDAEANALGDSPARIDIQVGPVSALTASDWEQIWGLTQRYVDTSRPYYEARLREYPTIALFRARGGGALVGITALDVYRTTFHARTATIIFTSSVVLDEHHRGQNLLQRLGLRTFLQARLRWPFEPVYWLFDTFSYKSYVLLPRNFRDYWPRHDRPTPAPTAAFLDHLARARYKAAWRPERGIVERSGHKKLMPTTAPIDDRLLADPHVRFFAAVNPGHQDGDMLVCLCPLTLRNWAHAALSAVSRRTRRPSPP